MTSKFAQAKASATDAQPARTAKPRIRTKKTVVHEVNHDALFTPPSSTRLMIATISSLVVSFVGGYAAAFVANTLSIAALTLSGSAFLAIAVWFIAAALGILAALNAGNAAFAVCIAYEHTSIARFINRARDQVVYTTGVAADRMRAAGRALVTPRVQRYGS